jgi:hypothetical protein
MPELIDIRAGRAGLSLAGLSRRAEIPYHRILGAARLTQDEQDRISAVIAEAERRQNRWRNAAAV